MTLLDVLQKVNRDAMEASQPTDMCVGTVVSIDPLEIEMDVHQAPLKEEVLVLTDAVKAKTIDSYFEEVNGVLCVSWGSAGGTVITRSLEVGDKVLMLSAKHGQKYIVLSRL